MNTARVSLCLAILLSWTPSSPTFAQQYSPPGQATIDDSPREDGTDDVHTRSIFDNRNYMIRTDAGDGVGYLRGFQTFAAFQPVIVVPDELIFWASPRGYVTYDGGNFAGNLGAGVRWLNPENQRILGGGFWYDHDNNGTQNFDQFGGSFESLGNMLDFRANAYIPTNGDAHLVSKSFNFQNIFIAHNIGIGRTTVTNSTLRGGDFETGGALPGIGDLGFRAYAGGYYYQGVQSGGGIYGVRGRVEALVTQNLWATIAVSHDRVFGTNVYGAATIYLGTGQSPVFMRRIPMQTRLYQQMERQYRIAVQREVENDFVLALRNGGTGGSGGPVGTPIFVDHVDNTAPAGGDGSVEHPFNHLPLTTPNNVDILFVHRGDGTSNNMNQGTTLHDFERLLGDGVQHLFTSTTGTFTLPGFTPGPLPNITNVNPGGSAVTLANHNEVSGFNINNSALHGITGTNIVDFNINNVNITNSGNSLGATPIGAGIQLTNATGTGLIFNSTFVNNNAEGVRIDNSAGGILVLSAANVLATGNLTGIELNANASQIDPVFSNVTASDNKHDGIAISLANGSGMTGSFDLITANGNNPTGVNPLGLTFGDGFRYNSNASSGIITITRSFFAQNNLNGVDFTTTNGSTLSAFLINNNAQGFDNNAHNGILFTNTDSQATATLLNNTIDNNGGIGIDVISKGTGVSPASFNLIAGGYLTQDTNGNGVLDLGENSVPIASLGPTILGNGLLNREGNTIIGNTGAGVAYTLLDQGTGSANIIGNTIQSTKAGAAAPYIGQGIDIRLTGTTVASNSSARFTGGVIDDNIIGSLTTPALGNAGGGIVVLADQNTSLQNLQIGTALKGNIIANNGSTNGLTDGINITRANTAQVGNATPITITNNQILDNIGSAAITTTDMQHGNGILISALDSFDGIVNHFIISNNQIDRNFSNGVMLHIEADAEAIVDIHHNDISHNGLDGVTTTEPVFTAPGDLRGIGGVWDQNTILANGGDGISLGAHSGTFLENLLIGSLISSANGNIIQNNAANGIQITGSGTAEIAFNLIDSNGAASATPAGGIYINAFTTNDYTIDNNVITNNGNFSVTTTDGGDGIQIVDAGAFTHSDGTYAVTVSNNTIRNNAGRGINVFNAIPFNQIGGGDNLTVDIENNNIKGNQLEGIYVVNTNSGDAINTATNISPAQRVNTLASQPMFHDGTVDSAPRLFLTVNNNDIEGNGILVQPFDVPSQFIRGINLNPVSGLVVRVGTSDGGFGPFSDNGFFGEGFGGVGANVTNNFFHGNKGDDVSFSSFISTVNPITAAGTWDATTFTITAYQSDPLSRLDLSFHNNVFDSAALNGGNLAQPLGPTDPTIAGAFYNDSDGTFKSRLFSATPPGPFASATRGRNAERLAARFLGILPPFTPQLAPNFRYPGEGQSTFRLIGATTIADVVQAGLITDNVPYLSPADANGVFAPNGVDTPLPFGWTLGTGTTPRPQ